MGWIAGPGKAPSMEKISIMFSSRFVQWTGPGGAVHGEGGGIVMGLIGRPGTAEVERGSAGHVHWLFCSAEAVVEEPLLLSEESVRVVNELVLSDLGRGGNRGLRR
jgi:hypothetical protein